MVNTRRTDIGDNGQRRPNGTQEPLTEAEMLRHLYGWTLTTDERLRRLEEGRANEGPSRENKDHTQEVNVETEEENNVHSEQPVPDSPYSVTDESLQQRIVPDMFTV